MIAFARFSAAAAAVLAAAAVSPAAAHFHDHDQNHHHMRHGGRQDHHHEQYHTKATEMAKVHAHALEDHYMAECAANPRPHGYYGAFLQPCTFSFIQADAASASGDACSAGKVIGRPVPMHWIFNNTDDMSSPEFWNKNNWRDVYQFSSSSSSSSSSSDSFDFDKVDWDAFAQHLMLWPDQCVGAGPRCYSIDAGDADDGGMTVRGGNMNENDQAIIMEALHRLFPDDNNAPWNLATFTHVQVDCQADAMELSRVIYATADVVDRAVPAIVAVCVAAIVVALVMGLWCCYAGVRLYKAWSDRGMNHKVQNMVYEGIATGKERLGYQKPTVVVVGDPVDVKSVEMSESKGSDTEYKRLLA